ncbi:MAG: SpoIIE family protein phosphatase [Crocinitomicaceae bacterium]|nr:SpoIIE family protein phosphatase [Crocinitomicaceae bacterium]
MTPRLILIFLIAFSPFFAGAQQDVEDILDKANDVYNENPAESFSFCEAAGRLAIEQGNTEFDAEIATCKARYYLLIAKYDAASAELNKAILFYENVDDKDGLAYAYSLKSILLDRVGDTDASHLMQLKVVNLDREANNVDALIGSLNNLSLDYYQSGDADSLKLIMEELASLEDDFYPTDYLYYYQNWAHYYEIINDFHRSIQHYLLALEVAENEKMTDSKATNLANLSRAYRLNNDFKKADEIGKQAYEFSQENNLIYETSEALVEWIAAKEALGDFRSAFDLQKKWTRIDKKINDLERIQKVKAIEGQLEIAEKEKKIAEGEIALQLSNLEGEKARTRNAWLFAIVLLVVVLLVYTAFIYVRTRKLNTTIQSQKEEVELKSMHLQEALTSIQDSLQYSKLIQGAMLPDAEEFMAVFEDHFILYKPKDIVSGDFYWINRSDERTIIAVGDCTGHGVPGAMVSMVCHEALNKVVTEQRISDPGKILDAVRDIVRITFENKTQNLNDGMDIALISLELRASAESENETPHSLSASHSVLKYAGAYNPVWIIRKKSTHLIESNEKRSVVDVNDHQLIELKADKQPIGYYHDPAPFNTQQFELFSGDSIYLFSDGFADQFGGDKGKKLKATNFKELLVNCQNMIMTDQQYFINKRFEDWKGQLEQVDDVCVIGVRI